MNGEANGEIESNITKLEENKKIGVPSEHRHSYMPYVHKSSDIFEFPYKKLLNIIIRQYARMSSGHFL